MTYDLNAIIPAVFHIHIRAHNIKVSQDNVYYLNVLSIYNAEYDDIDTHHYYEENLASIVETTDLPDNPKIKIKYNYLFASEDGVLTATYGIPNPQLIDYLDRLWLTLKYKDVINAYNLMKDISNLTKNLISENNIDLQVKIDTAGTIEPFRL